jgi:tetratricopeptide (TPR) repeat protein
LFNYGYYLLRTRQPDLAKAAFEKGFAVDPKNQLNKVGLGAVALAKGDRAGAKLAMDEAVKNSKGKDVNVLFRAGEAYSGYVAIDSLKSTYKATDPAEAIRLLDMAVALMLKNKQEIADVYMAKGDAFFTKGESGAAVSAYEDAVRVNPNNAKAIAKIGKIYWGGKNLPLAQENFKKAIELDPDYAPAVHEYAELHLQCLFRWFERLR